MQKTNSSNKSRITAAVVAFNLVVILLIVLTIGACLTYLYIRGTSKDYAATIKQKDQIIADKTALLAQVEEYLKTRDVSQLQAIGNAIIVQKVGQLVALPTDETPEVTQIKDMNKLKDQPFFGNAKDGDYILFYKKNKKAVVYRESNNQLVNVGPVADEVK